jgi:hypothetical protein
VSLPIAGAKLDVASAVKPALDGMVREQINALETRLRNDPFIENAARSQWTKLCRAIPLSGGGQAGAPASAATAASGLPNLWLEKAGARHRRVAAGRRQCADAAGRRASANSHRGERNQTRLSVPQSA